MAQLVVDLEADAAYLQLTDEPVAETYEAAPGVLVDLDEFGCAVGVEVLSLALPIPALPEFSRFHLRRDDLNAVSQLRPSVSAFVARCQGGASRVLDVELVAS